MLNLRLPLILLVTATLIILYSCSKKSETTPAPTDQQEEPVRLEKHIRRYKVGDEIKVDTYSFKYDAEGRVTSQIISGGPEERYGYTDAKLTSIQSVGTSGTNDLLNYSYYSENEDTVLLDFTRPDQTGAGMDTVQLTYIFDGDNVVEFWTYLHLYSGFHDLQKQGFVYNSSGNLVYTTFENLTTTKFVDYTVMDWDNKVNPKHGQPKMNHMLLRAGLPLMSTSLHNPLQYTFGSQTIDVAMTYNDEGYPLTVKLSKDDFVATELIYNR